MDRRQTVRGGQQQRRSVKALGQMFEELIRVSISGSETITACAAPNNSYKNQNSQVENSRLRGIPRNKDEKSACGQCNAPAVTTVDGNHVKNRKQFFEEQAQVSETNCGKAKLSNETNTTIPSATKYTSNKLEETPYSKNRTSREICACDVKSKRQIFEDYANSIDNKKSVPTKPIETIGLQQKKFYNDILNSTPTLNSYSTMKTSVLEDAPRNDKAYVSASSFRSSTNNLNNDEDINATNVATSDIEEKELMQHNTEEEYKSIDVDFDSIEKCSTCDGENVNNLDCQDFEGTKKEYTQRNFEEKTSDDETTKDTYDIADGRNDINFKEGNSEPNDVIKDIETSSNDRNEKNIIKDYDIPVFIENLEETLLSNNKNEEDSGVVKHQYSRYYATASEANIESPNEDLIQNIEASAESALYAKHMKNQDVDEDNEGVTEDEDAEDIRFTCFPNYYMHQNLEENHKQENYNQNEENADVIKNQDIGIVLSEPLIAEYNGRIDEEEHKERANITKNEDHENLGTSSEDLIKLSEENFKENNKVINFLESEENLNATEHEDSNLFDEVIQKPNKNLEEDNEDTYHNIFQVSAIDERNEDIYHNILQVSAIDEPNEDIYQNIHQVSASEDIWNTNENTIDDARLLPLSKTELGNGTDDVSSLIHIEECISDVTQAFESINVLCNKPRWNVWDIAKKQEATTLVDIEDEVFGTILDIDNDFCVETINNGQQNVLFKIWYGRKALTPESEYDHLLTDTNVNYDGDMVNKMGDEDAEYSYIDEDDDERDDISGTFFDKDENPRIEIIGDHRSDSDLHIPQLNIPKTQYMILKELIDSEEIYLNKMKYIIDNYLQHFRCLEVSSNIELVFGNIEEICDETEKIYSTMQVCVSIDEIARVFLKSVHVFDCYTEYRKNKRKSAKYANEQFCELIKERQVELDDQYTCESYFLNVIERPERYKSLLEKLRKALTKSGTTSEPLNEAIIMLDRKIQEANTILAIDSIKLCPIELKKMEPFLMKEAFNIKRKYKSVVFLFRGGVIFCVEDQDEPEIYDYVESIEMDKLAIKHSNSSISFQLSYYDKSKWHGDESQYEFNIEAPSMAVKEKWVDEIQRILWSQLQYYKDQQKNTTILNQNQQHRVAENTYDDDEVFGSGLNESSKNAKENEGDEYFTIQDVLYEEERDKISGTFFDKHENPRIEIIRSDSIMGVGLYMENIPRSQYMIIKELINTEETYLRKMKHIIDSYYVYFKNMGAPSDIQIVFGNIQDIYDETERLYSKFLECDSVDGIAKVFLDNAHIFDLYTGYMRNKSISYIYANTKFKKIIKDRQIELEDQYTCDSYLLNPVQRPGRYKLLLEKLEKELFKTNETSESLKNAVALINEKITETNTLMTIDSIQKCPINLEKMGPFIMKETFNIKRKYRSVLFLFKDIIVFCTENQTHPDTYTYIDGIEMTKLTISHNRCSTSFQLRNFDKSKLGEENKYTFDVEAPSMSVKERWMDEIQRLLWGQLQYFKDQQKKTSLNKLGPTMSFIRKGSMKEKTKPYDSAKARKRSTFYYDIK